MRQSIAGFKYGGRREYGTFYAAELAAHYGAFIKRLGPDVLIPVPVHRSRKRMRGYNQAEVLAYELEKLLHIPVLSEVLIRTRKTVPQKELDDKERLFNLSKAFAVDDKYKSRLLPVNKAIIIDDIYTTGSTIEACSRILKKEGVNKVYFLVLCIGKGF